MKRLFIILMAFFFVSGCDDEMAELNDSDFQAFVPGEKKLTDIKGQFPRFSEEFVWQSQGDEGGDEKGAEVTLVYHTRHGHYFMRFENDILLHKRKLP